MFKVNDMIKAVSHLNCSKNGIGESGKTSLDITIMPLATSGFTITESVHAEALFTPFVPRSFVVMTIGKVIDSKAMDFITKVLASISISIPITKIRLHQLFSLQNR